MSSICCTTYNCVQTIFILNGPTPSDILGRALQYNATPYMFRLVVQLYKCVQLIFILNSWLVADFLKIQKFEFPFNQRPTITIDNNNLYVNLVEKA